MTIKTARNLRRVSQLVFFLIFLWLIVKTSFEVDFHVANPDGISLPWPVSIALQFDPLVAVSTLLATGTLYTGLFVGIGGADSDDFPWPVLLRLGMPAGDIESLGIGDSRRAQRPESRAADRG